MNSRKIVNILLSLKSFRRIIVEIKLIWKHAVLELVIITFIGTTIFYLINNFYDKIEKIHYCINEYTLGFASAILALLWIKIFSFFIFERQSKIDKMYKSLDQILNDEEKKQIKY